MGFVTIVVNKSEFEVYNVITEDVQKSIVSGAVRAALLGPVELLASLCANNKGTCTIAIKFKNGKNRLIKVGDKIYKAFVTVFSIR